VRMNDGVQEVEAKKKRKFKSDVKRSSRR
jgi:hypothetical protein